MSRIREDDEDEQASLVFPKRVAAFKYGIARSRLAPRAPPNPCLPGSLDRIATSLRRFQAEFRNANFYAYRTDGNAVYIRDGGDDMYDNGNYTSPWLRSGILYVDGTSEPDGEFISYGDTTETVVDDDFRYISLGYVQGVDLSVDDGPQDDSRHPLMVLGTRCDGPVGWQIAGELGADGNGNTQLFILYSGQTVEGFQVHAAARQVWAANDPTLCNVILLIGSPAWGSAFGPVDAFADTDTNSNGFYLYAGEGSRSILAVHFVLSKPEDASETPISSAELRAVIGRFLRRLAAA